MDEMDKVNTFFMDNLPGRRIMCRIAARAYKEKHRQKSRCFADQWAGRKDFGVPVETAQEDRSTSWACSSRELRGTWFIWQDMA